MAEQMKRNLTWEEVIDFLKERQDILGKEKVLEKQQDQQFQVSLKANYEFNQESEKHRHFQAVKGKQLVADK